MIDLVCCLSILCFCRNSSSVSFANNFFSFSPVYDIFLYAPVSSIPRYDAKSHQLRSPRMRKPLRQLAEHLYGLVASKIYFLNSAYSTCLFVKHTTYFDLPSFILCRRHLLFKSSLSNLSSRSFVVFLQKFILLG